MYLLCIIDSINIALTICDIPEAILSLSLALLSLCHEQEHISLMHANMPPSLHPHCNTVQHEQDTIQDGTVKQSTSQHIAAQCCIVEHIAKRGAISVSAVIAKPVFSFRSST